MCRGNNGQKIFLTPDGYQLFLSTLDEVCGQTGWRVHAYCLMPNHYHLLLETPEANLVAGMKWFQGTYTQRFNAMFKRRGHVFQGRYKAIPVQTDPLEGGLSYFRMVSTYIHLNPFRAKMAGVGLEKKLEQFPWSSYPLYTGRGRKVPDWLVREKVLGTWGIPKQDTEGLQTYREKMLRFMRFELDPDSGRRGEFEKQIKRGWYLGAEAFADRLLEKVKGTDKQQQLQGDERRAHTEKEAERLLANALVVLNCSEAELVSMKQNQVEKQAVAWLLKSHTTVTVIWIAQRLQMGHRTNATRGISRIRKSTDARTRKLRTKMLQCTA